MTGDTAVIVLLALFSLVLSLHCVMALYSTLRIFGRQSYLDAVTPDSTALPPMYGFTVLLPCRHEELVIGETLRGLSVADYPSAKLQVLVLCTPDDAETIKAARQAIRANGMKHAKVVVFDGLPGKPRALNIGLSHAKHDIVTIFDAEDDVSPDLFRQIDALLQRNNEVDVVQSGVQIMNHRSRWFSVHGVLEYYFWYKYRLPTFCEWGVTPLGGNTVFMKRRRLMDIGGWDESALTEDADIGLRLNAAGAVVKILYSPSSVTKEEAPTTVSSFIKQRTRWSQGFLQVLMKLRTIKRQSFWQKILWLYILTTPLFFCIVLLASIGAVWVGLRTSLSTLEWYIMLPPLLLLVFVALMSLVGLWGFSKDQKEDVSVVTYVWLLVTFLPYQMLLILAAARASMRHVLGSVNWEKTDHQGMHRRQSKAES